MDGQISQIRQVLILTTQVTNYINEPFTFFGLPRSQISWDLKKLANHLKNSKLPNVLVALSTASWGECFQQKLI